VRTRHVVAIALLSGVMPRVAAAEDLVVKGELDSPWEGFAGTTVGKRDLDERLPRSAPDALRFEPGVFVQQTAHGQASPFVRGRTGQQTVLLFDGIRLNNSTYRQGPNQYFFTVDARSIHAVDVLRGGASTLYGSDAIGGVLHARPIEPTWDPDVVGPYFRPRAFLRVASADSEFAERAMVDAQLDPFLVVVGVGFRRVGELRSGGPVRSPVTGAIPQVPAFEDDGKTQLGTGFKELTSDARVVYRLGDDKRIVAATYLYRQYDAPRTDQCPPPFASRTECLKYLEQFRTLSYLAFEGRLGSLAKSRLALSYQRQHELRSRDRPRSFVQDLGRDDVDTFGLMAAAETDKHPLAENVYAKLGFGGDAYFDRLRSLAWIHFTDIDYLRRLGRGQYVDGSSYAQGGAYLRGDLYVRESVVVRAGARGGLVRASSPQDPESATAAIDKTWTTWSAFGQAEWTMLPGLSLLGSIDRSYRAPNLDDLTSRQQSGPGFQFENAALSPETALSFEAGVRVAFPRVVAELWTYRSMVRDAITRVTRSSVDCPPATPQCVASWNRFQLQNAYGSSTIDGLELSTRVQLPGRVLLRATLAYAYGEGPNPQEKPSDPSIAYEPRVPLSRVPPLNGTLDARWSIARGLYVGASLRWALAQTRLAIADRSDARIPEGGTPGFAVIDLRAGYRVGRNFLFALALENVTDAAYRYHGSSINGPGRGVIASIESGL